ncbi:Hsp20 family protein [Marinobacterium arenosum]|uniref:Hsp20 family protein n=1 Tax=Marinobacterium arenosum TaxID=2862496 RepID=UPI001C942E61|nr:Hsp20 family protein [Marinobacterium arenosum]MBY4677025.1 Hsp20 family protein [Marinobacterium arenosum]
MNTIDLSPLYRSFVGFDRLANLLNQSQQQGQAGSGYPPYNIELIAEDRYAITLAVAGFQRDELQIQLEQGVLTVRGAKSADAEENHNYLYQGIATRTFERKFHLADHVEVSGAKLDNGLLTVELFRELPEAMKPREIRIDSDTAAIEHQAQPSSKDSAA